MKSWTEIITSAASFLLALSLLVLMVMYLDSPALVGDSRASTWFPLVNLNHNGFHSWRLDHITQLAAWLNPAYNFAERPIIGTLLLLPGTYFFLRRCNTHGHTWQTPPWIGAAASTMAILLITGFDPVVIGAVAWLPFIGIFAYSALTQPHPTIALIALALASIESSYSSNQAALITASSALWLTHLLTLSGLNSRRRIGLVCAVTLAPAIIATLTAPIPELPHYPKSSHVLPFDGVNGTVRPLLGPAYPFETLDRAAMRSDYKSRAIILLSLSALAWWTRRRHQTPVARYTAKVGLVLALLAALNTSLPEPWATISPLPSISRIIPWGTSYSVLSVALGLGTWMTTTSLILNTAWLSLLPLTAVAVAVTAIGSPNIFSPQLRRNGVATDSKLGPLVLSPSAVIFRSLSLFAPGVPEQLESIHATSRITGKDIRDIDAQVEVYPPPSPESLEMAHRAESAWRWSSRTGAQRGDETLTIRFKSPLTLRGLELDPGPFFTDFPRGLKITGGPCEQSSAPTLVDYPVWQGPLHLLPRGIPYYAPRNEVRIVFPAPTTVSCLFVYQTAQAPFDWSVAKVSVFLTAP
jgi:hypothetical protein